jgi:hypothetical protein
MTEVQSPNIGIVNSIHYKLDQLHEELLRKVEPFWEIDHDDDEEYPMQKLSRGQRIFHGTHYKWYHIGKENDDNYIKQVKELEEIKDGTQYDWYCTMKGTH